MIAEEEVLPPFKRTSLTNNSTGVKKRLWKSLKQITSTERTLQWSDDAVTCKLIKCKKLMFVDQKIFFFNVRHFGESSSII